MSRGCGQGPREAGRPPYPGFMTEPLLSVDQVAEHLGIAPDAVVALIRGPEAPLGIVRTADRRFLIPESVLPELAARQQP